jgi:type IV pilus assembly protein PilB
MLGRILVRRGLVTLDQLGDALSEQFGVPFVEIVPQAVNPQVVRLLPEKLARQRSCVPIGVSGSTMQLAMVAPDDIYRLPRGSRGVAGVSRSGRARPRF